ncbi:prepilin peptidase [Paenibacillus sp. HJGM_3]|uniref:A24 family peptidase n=1 Tax=Paenibacillus sp. HJGM_3 TaxID=3379816 RepID=UPI00385BBB29
MAVSIALLVLLIAAFVQDVRQSRIANTITVPGIFTGLLVSPVCSENGWLSGLLDSAAGLVVGLSVMLVFYAFGAVGAGDVKLFGAIGSIAGLPFVLYGMMNALLCAGLVGLAILVWRKEVLSRIGTVLAVLFRFWMWRELRALTASGWGSRTAPLHFPFMYAVAPAIGLTWWTLGYPSF